MLFKAFVYIVICLKTFLSKLRIMNFHFYGDSAKFVIYTFLSTNTG